MDYLKNYQLKSDRNKYLEHVIFNVVLGYQVEKEISMSVKSIKGDTNVTAQDCLHTLKTIKQLLIDISKHTQVFVVN